MNDLERLELILRRIHAKRQRDYDEGSILNLDTQCLLLEIADELHRDGRSCITKEIDASWSDSK